MDSEYSMGYQLTMELIREGREFTAIAGQNDMMALGAIDSLDALREVVACSFENKTYLPEGDASAWDEPYACLLRLQK